MFCLASSWVCMNMNIHVFILTCTCSTNTLHTHAHTQGCGLRWQAVWYNEWPHQYCKAINEVHPYTETEGYLRDIVSEKYKVYVWCNCILIIIIYTMCMLYTLCVYTMRPARLHIVLWAGFFPGCVKRRLDKGIETFSHIGLLFTIRMKYSKIKMTKS